MTQSRSTVYQDPYNENPEGFPTQGEEEEMEQKEDGDETLNLSITSGETEEPPQKKVCKQKEEKHIATRSSTKSQPKKGNKPKNK